MTVETMATAATATPAPRRSDRPLVRRLLTHPTGGVSLVLLAALLVVAATAQWLAPYDPTQTDVFQVLAAPSSEHLLGGDSAGRDVLSRLLVATAYSLAGGVLVAGVASVIGVAGGLIAGYFGGWADAVGAWLTALTMALPAVVVLLAARAAVGPSLWWSMALFGVLVSPAYYRVVYGAVRGVRNELYIDAARTSGLSTPRIIGRHVLVAVRAPVILLTAGIVSAGIAMMAGLDFLGLGDPATPSWGQMLSDGFYNINRTGLLILWPALVLGITMIALVLLGTAVRDELEGTADVGKPPTTPWSLTEAAPATLSRPGDDDLDPLLQLDDLAVAYPAGDTWTTVVKGVSLVVRRGQTHGLIGESGSGKTQTAFAVLGLLPRGGKVMAGSVVFDGQDLTRMDDTAMTALRGKRIAYVPQEPMSNLDPTSTVGAQLTTPLRVVLGMTRAQAEERAIDLLARVGIPDPRRTFRSYPHQLSGGMAQRVLIAGAVSTQPDLIIADEPTTALDVTVQAEVLDLLRELRDDLGMAVLLVTHNFGVVADLCDHVSVMRQGVVVESGPTADVFRDPQHEYTRRLLDSIPAGAPRAPMPGLTSSGSVGRGMTS
ncbi:ATP-binding cassette domain-containing protein [Cellulomonas sp. Y8]|uniref:ATP-binding cassette domain-containing protein n=1 Tax=Cellulomonas sp. Y8 TaxID=2591145 RepID=UPI003D733BF8